MRIEIITPTDAFPLIEATVVDVPAVTGRMTLLPGHQPLVCILEAGQIILECDRKRATWKIGPGTIMVKDDKVTILAKSAKQL